MIKEQMERQTQANGEQHQEPDDSATSSSTALIALDDVPTKFSMAFARHQPFAEPTTLLAPYSISDDVFAAALSGDTMSYICNLCGLRQFSVMALVCTTWHDAIQRKMREWGLLTHVRTLGRGYGRLRGQFDSESASRASSQENS